MDSEQNAILRKDNEQESAAASETDPPRYADDIKDFSTSNITRLENIRIQKKISLDMSQKQRIASRERGESLDLSYKIPEDLGQNFAEHGKEARRTRRAVRSRSYIPSDVELLQLREKCSRLNKTSCKAVSVDFVNDVQKETLASIFRSDRHKTMLGCRTVLSANELRSYTIAIDTSDKLGLSEYGRQDSIFQKPKCKLQRPTSFSPSLPDFTRNDVTKSSLKTSRNSQVNISLRDLKNCNSVRSLDRHLRMSMYSFPELVCKICHSESPAENLISPCYCSGSVGFVHEACLVHWMQSAKRESCELCHARIEMITKLKPIGKWSFPATKPVPVFWVMVFVAVIVLNTASITKDASKHCISVYCCIFYAVAAIGIIFSTVFLYHCGKKSRRHISDWVQTNTEYVISKDKSISKKESIV